MTPTSNLLSSLFFFTLIPLFSRNSIADDTLKQGQSINDTQSIVSAAEIFELGFFSQPQATNLKYLAIWYKGVVPKTVVWVANRDTPVLSSSATLNFVRDGNLVLLNQTGAAFWSSNSTKSIQNPIAQLLDTGNLVLRDSKSEDYVWQSFDYPTDTLLPGMKIGWDSKTGLNRKLKSWTSSNDVSSGEFSFSLNTNGLPQFFVHKGNKTMFRGWPWFDHDFGQSYGNGFNYDLVFDVSTEISFSYNDSAHSRTRIVMDSSGSILRHEWNDEGEKWRKAYSFDGAGCNDYDLCGNFGLCNPAVTTSCGCLYGFEQISTKNLSNGCVRRDPKICEAGDGFIKISKVKWPDSTGDSVKMKLGVKDCEAECLKDCGCLAYGTVQIPKIGLACVNWFHKLVDIRYVPDVGSGDDIYVRVAASELESADEKRSVAVVVAVPIVSVMVFLGLIGGWFFIRRRARAMGELICRCKLSSFLFFSTIIALFSTKSLAIDSIKAGESINGSTQMLISPAKKFVLGIFNPQGSKFHYLGIWYNNIPQTVVWVANRDNPLVNSSAHLVFKGENIVLLNQTGWILWTSNSPRSLKEREVQLLDTGNLVLRETGSQDYAWQSFDYPSDTLLPGMKLGWDSKTGLNRKLTSWKNPNDPSSGDYTYGVEMDGLPQLVVRKGPIITFRGGPWYGKRFSGSGDLRATAIYAPKFDYNGDEHRALFSYEARNNFSVRLVLGAAGLFQQLYWVDDGEYWYPLYTLPGDGCDVYGICGEFGVCTFSLTAECDCMDGFEPKWPDDWEMFRRSGGCVRKDNRTCGNGEGFKRISSVKFPDSSGYFVNVNMSIQDCEAACLNNCSCLAYGIMELPNGGYGCVTWFHKLMDVKFVVYNGQDLYVRVAASELDSTNKKLKVAVSVSVASFLGFLGFVICFILGRRRKDRGNVITPEITAERMFSRTDKSLAEASTSNEVTVTLVHGR
ncbi:S-locus-specific glycoprotein S13, partial [Cucurbita argyrosperma subsp. sororia]